MNLRRVWWALGVVLVAVALAACLVPMQEIPSAFEWNDKASHLFGHAALAAYFSGLVARRSWWKLCLCLITFGIAIEFAQHVMQLGRNGDVRDVFANSLGTLAGLLLGWLGVSRWPELAAWLLGRRVES